MDLHHFSPNRLRVVNKEYIGVRINIFFMATPHSSLNHSSIMIFCPYIEIEFIIERALASSFTYIKRIFITAHERNYQI